jgi:hypothetical protein
MSAWSISYTGSAGIGREVGDLMVDVFNNVLEGIKKAYPTLNYSERTGCRIIPTSNNEMNLNIPTFI